MKLNCLRRLLRRPWLATGIQKLFVPEASKPVLAPAAGMPSPGLAHYRRLNTIFVRSKERFIAFVEIAFISILFRRLKRLVGGEPSA
jgi:hypothetical protein